MYGILGWAVAQYYSITFLVSLSANGVSIYETHNNGRWYEFVFMLGMGAYAGNREVRQTTGY